MENSIIAVQVYNGTFVPVLNTSSKTRRRLVLTTVADNQTSVKIGLYKGSDESMSDPEYVGSLVIDNVAEAQKGDPDITLLLGVDESGNLNATATDKSSGEYQSLSVGLEALAGGGYDVPDFDLNDEELTLDDLSMEEDELDLGDDLSLDEEDDSLVAESPDLELPEGEIELDAEEPSEWETGLEEVAEEATGESAAGEPGEEDEFAGLSDFNDDSISFDDSLADETLDAELDTSSEAEELTDLTFDDLDEDLEEPETEAELEETIEEVETVGEEGSIAEELSEPEEAEDFASVEFGVDESDDVSFDDETISLGGDDFSMDTVSFGDDAEEDLAEEDQFGEEIELDGPVDEAEVMASDASEAEGSELGEGMIETDLGEEDFTFDEEVPAFDSGEDEFGNEFESALETEMASQEEFEGEVSAETIEDTISPEEFARLDSEPAHREPVDEEFVAGAGALAPRRSNGAIFVGYLVLALAALGVLTYFIFRLMEGPPAPPLRASMVTGLAFIAPAAWPRRKRKSRPRR